MAYCPLSLLLRTSSLLTRGRTPVSHHEARSHGPPPLHRDGRGRYVVVRELRLYFLNRAGSAAPGVSRRPFFDGGQLAPTSATGRFFGVLHKLLVAWRPQATGSSLAGSGWHCGISSQALPSGCGHNTSLNLQHTPTPKPDFFFESRDVLNLLFKNV